MKFGLMFVNSGPFSSPDPILPLAYAAAITKLAESLIVKP